MLSLVMGAKQRKHFVSAGHLHGEGVEKHVHEVQVPA
jgi:hypothetical protein